MVLLLRMETIEVVLPLLDQRAGWALITGPIKTTLVSFHLSIFCNIL